MGSKYKTHLKLLGKEFVSKYGEIFTVIDYENNEEVTIQYNDGTIVKTKSVNIRNGFPPNPNRPVIYEKGYHGVGNHRISDESGKTPAYIKWHGMICRVHDGNHNTEKLPTACYNGVCVADDWYNFQNFAEWYYTVTPQYSCNDVLCLDKDLLAPGSKIYSKETCCLLPYRLNIAIQLATVMNFDKRRNKFRPRLSINGNRTAKYIGEFRCEADAWEAYFKTKDEYV